MSQLQPVYSKPRSLPCEVDLSSRAYRFVARSSGKAVVAGAGEYAAGQTTAEVADFSALPGGSGTLEYDDGEDYIIETGGSFSAGDQVASDAQGRAVAASSGDWVLGRARTASGGAGEFIICDRIRELLP